MSSGPAKIEYLDGTTRRIVNAEQFVSPVLAISSVTPTGSDEAKLLPEAIGERAMGTVEDRGNSISVADASISAFYLGLGTAYLPAPSGTAASDLSRIAAAQDRATRYIELQDGSYLAGTSGVVWRNGQELIGHGSGKTILRATGVTAADSILGGNDLTDVEINGLTVDYANFREPSSGFAPVAFRNFAKLRLRDVNVINFPRYALALNKGTELLFEHFSLIRSVAPKDQTGAAIALGQQNQALVISQFSGDVQKGIVRNGLCKGSAINISCSDYVFDQIEVDVFDFGCAYVTEQDPRCHDIQFLACLAQAGRTNPATGLDVNATSAGAFEIWSPRTIVDRCKGRNLGGDGVSLGGKNSRVTNNEFRLLGMQVPSNGITSRYELSGAYSADGSMIANNTVIDTIGDGSDLLLPYYEQSLTEAMVVRLEGNDFGSIPFTRKGLGAKWGSPGMLIEGGITAYSHAAGATTKVADLSIAGAVRGRDVIVGVTFRAANGGAPLPVGLRAFGEVSDANLVSIYVQDVRVSQVGTVAVPAGTFSARLVTVA